jgi:hypothetical protein
MPNNNEPPAQQQRLNSNSAPRIGRGPKIKKILVFKGKGIQEYYNFET